MRPLFICALTALTLSPLPASAAIVTHDLSVEYTGATPPAGAAPWIRITLDDQNTTGSVNVTISALNLVGTEFVNDLHLNLDPALNPALLTVSGLTKVGTFADPQIQGSVNAFSAASGGAFDILVDFDNAPPANRFTAGESVSFTLGGIATLSATSFSYLSVPGGQGAFLAAAHVQGIGANGNDSGWVTTPEPATLVTLAGAAGILLARRRR